MSLRPRYSRAWAVWVLAFLVIEGAAVMAPRGGRHTVGARVGAPRLPEFAGKVWGNMTNGDDST